MKLDCVCVCCVRRIDKRIVVVVVCIRSERETINISYFRFILISGYVDRARILTISGYVDPIPHRWIAKFGILRTRQQCGLDTTSRPRSE